jgi:hypothetical protein
MHATARLNMHMDITPKDSASALYICWCSILTRLRFKRATEQEGHSKMGVMRSGEKIGGDEQSTQGRTP